MTPLVFVHGFMGGSDQWRLQDPLASKRPLIRVDLPGFGRNAHMSPIDRIEGFSDWVLKELTGKGITRFDLLGHSMGGMVVQEMIRRAPARIRRLVLYGTGAIGVLPGRFESIETSMDRARADGPQVTARRIAATWFLDRESAPEYPACAAIAEQSGLPAILAGLDAMRSWSGMDHLPAIETRTLILWGDGDRTYPWSQTETLWKAVSRCNLAVVPSCAHAIHLERAPIFNDLIEGFLKSE